MDEQTQSGKSDEDTLMNEWWEARKTDNPALLAKLAREMAEQLFVYRTRFELDHDVQMFIANDWLNNTEKPSGMGRTQPKYAALRINAINYANHVKIGLIEDKSHIKTLMKSFGVDRDTVRGWLRRYKDQAPKIPTDGSKEIAKYINELEEKYKISPERFFTIVMERSGASWRAMKNKPRGGDK